MTNPATSLADARAWLDPETGKFRPGNPGAALKPPGALGKRSKRDLAEAHARTPAAWRVIDQKLEAGDAKVAMWLLARFLPDQRVVELPDCEPGTVAGAMADGSLTIGEAAKMSATVKALKDAETVDLLRGRLDEIEAILAAKGRA